MKSASTFMSSLPKFAGIAAALAATFVAIPKSQAAIVSLNFENIDPTNSNNVLIQDFYNGGISSSGTSGTNYGVTFSSNALQYLRQNWGTRANEKVSITSFARVSGLQVGIISDPLYANVLEKWRRYWL